MLSNHAHGHRLSDQSSEDRVDGKERSEEVGQPPLPLPAGGHLHRSLLCPQLPTPQEAPCHPWEGHPVVSRAFQAHTPPSLPWGRGCPVPPPPEKLTWDLLCGLLPCLVGAAPALGQEGRRTTAENQASPF